MGAANHRVKPLDFHLFSDENINPDVVRGLRARGFDVRTAAEEGLVGRPDAEILGRATNHGRVVVTHDLAFDRTAIRNGTTGPALYQAGGGLNRRGPMTYAQIRRN